jgi:hypothetical protein
MLIRFRNAIDSGGNMSTILTDHSDAKAYDGFGVASFTLGAIAVLSFGVLSVFATAVNKSEGANAVIGECLALIWIMDSLGIGLGIASILRRQASKAYPVLGIAMNLGLILSTAALLAIGLHMR